MSFPMRINNFSQIFFLVMTKDMHDPKVMSQMPQACYQRNQNPKAEVTWMMTGFPSTRTIMFSWDEKIPHVARSFQKETCRTEKLSSIDATC